MNENNEQNKNKLIKIGLISFAGSLPFFLGIFTVFVAVFFVLGLFEFDESSSSSGGSTSFYREAECGFTISKSALTKSEYKEKLEEFAATQNSNFQIFADNANAIYKYAESKKINPELVAVRAYVEGHGTTTGNNNYWGIGCYNGAGIDACHDYATFEEGYTDFINLVSQYSSLTNMMSKYAYIGAYWYNPGASDLGGCYYASHIYTESNMPASVKNACSSTAPKCTKEDTTNCTKTTAEDQNAYAKWQVQRAMGSARYTIFGLRFDEGPCTYGTGNVQVLEDYIINAAGLQILDRKLTTTEIDNLTKYLNNEIDKAEHGTGASVAAAGQSLIDWLAKKGYYLQYYWGGGHYGIGDFGGNFMGVNPNWGSSEFGCDPKNRCYWGFDCSGFVSWAIRMGCSENYYTREISDMWHGKVIDITEAKPGDISIATDNSHVRLVVKNNGDGSVIIAESTGGGYNKGGLFFTLREANSSYKYIDMTEYYQKTCSR